MAGEVHISLIYSFIYIYIVSIQNWRIFTQFHIYVHQVMDRSRSYKDAYQTNVPMTWICWRGSPPKKDTSLLIDFPVASWISSWVGSIHGDIPIMRGFTEHPIKIDDDLGVFPMELIFGDWQIGHVPLPFPSFHGLIRCTLHVLGPGFALAGCVQGVADLYIDEPRAQRTLASFFQAARMVT